MAKLKRINAVRNKLTLFISKIWYQNKPRHIICYLLWPFSLIYALAIICRRYCYQIRLLPVHQFNVPVIVVGNINAGGTGKTPLVIWLVQYLQNNGYSPGIVSRGYGMKNNAEVLLLTDKTFATTQTYPDEAMVCFKRTQAPIALAANRSLAVEKLIKDYHCDIIISDDGLQHYALARDIEIVVVDGERWFGNGFLIPAGPLRERRNRLAQVDLIVVNQSNTISPKTLTKNRTRTFAMSLTGKQFINIKQPELVCTPAELLDKKIYAVAGIGHPKRFFNSLKSLGLTQFTEMPFPDHYAYQSNDFNSIQDAVVIMTEKDAVKCRAFASPHLWYLPMTTQVDAEFAQHLAMLLAQLKKNSMSV